MVNYHSQTLPFMFYQLTCEYFCETVRLLLLTVGKRWCIKLCVVFLDHRIHFGINMFFLLRIPLCVLSLSVHLYHAQSTF